jgi:REP element-mobilizing transposase RayT
VTFRGNGRRRIFVDDRDRERLLWRLEQSTELYDVRLYLLCLMDTHFHLVVETPRSNISRFMQSVLTGYSVYFDLSKNVVQVCRAESEGSGARIGLRHRHERLDAAEAFEI